MVAGGLESISLVGRGKRNMSDAQNEWLSENKPTIYDSMLETGEVVAERYQISREAQDQFALESQQKTAAAQDADVIKVEAPGGDPGRAWGPPFWGSDSTLFLSANRSTCRVKRQIPEGDRGVSPRPPGRKCAVRRVVYNGRYTACPVWELRYTASVHSM